MTVSRVFEIAKARWGREQDRSLIVGIRNEVFVVEQAVPIEIELDGADAHCRHLLAFDAQHRAIGTARMQASGHVGRIAVVAAWRKHGVGSRLVEAMIERARAAGLESVDLDSQVHALGFYEKLGFEVCGEVFMEAGIPHQNMLKEL